MKPDTGYLKDRISGQTDIRYNPSLKKELRLKLKILCDQILLNKYGHHSTDIISYIISYHIISYHIISYHIISYRAHYATAFRRKSSFFKTMLIYKNEESMNINIPFKLNPFSYFKRKYFHKV